MDENDWSIALHDLREDLGDVEVRANIVSKQLSDRCKILESLKIGAIEYKLEKQRRRIAGARGFSTLKKDNLNIGLSLGAALAGMILGAAVSKNDYAALSGGLGAFNACLQEFGQSLWAVSLDRSMTVVPRDQIIPGRVWVTWESFTEAINDLTVKALNGKQLGDLEAILSELNQDHKTLKHLIKLSNGQIYSQQ